VSGGRVVALSGGIGGAKLALGLYRRLGERLTVVCNPGDDFEHLGLTVCPDLDTVVYTLSGLADTEKGWGLAGETWSFMAAVGRLGGETWFNLGDGDVAMHVERTRRLAAGQTPTAIAADISGRLGIAAAVLPASDRPVRTWVETPEGPLLFQHYFVRERCAPTVMGFTFRGAEAAAPSPAVLAALRSPDLAAIVICPSNPFISIDPMLAIPGMRAALRDAGVPVIAVSPIVGGQSVKGPTAKMMAELGLEISAPAVAARYGGLLDGFVLDVTDAALAPAIEAAGPRVLVTQTLMHTLDDRLALADAVLDFAADLRP